MEQKTDISWYKTVQFNTSKRVGVTVYVLRMPVLFSNKRIYFE